MNMQAEVLPDVKVSVEIGGSIDVQLAVKLITALTKFRDDMQGLRAGKDLPTVQELVAIDADGKSHSVQVTGDHEEVVEFLGYFGGLLQLRAAWLQGKVPPLPAVLSPQLQEEFARLVKPKQAAEPASTSKKAAKPVGTKEKPYVEDAAAAVPYLVSAFRMSMSISTITLLGCVVKHFREQPFRRVIDVQWLLRAVQAYHPRLMKSNVRELVRSLYRRMQRLFTSNENEILWHDKKVRFTPTFVTAVEAFHKELPPESSWREQLDRMLGPVEPVGKSSTEPPIESIAEQPITTEQQPAVSDAQQAADELLEVGDWGIMKSKLVRVREHIIDPQADPKSIRVYRVVDFDRGQDFVTFVDTVFGITRTVRAVSLEGHVYL